MRIVCPACSTTYEIPPAQLGSAARLVRCARCQAEWTVEPAAEHEVAPEPAAALPAEHVAATPVAFAESGRERLIPAPIVEPRPVERLRVPPRSTPRGLNPSERTALGVSVVILCGLIACAFIWRGELMTIWPASRRLFGWFGLG